MEIFEGDSGSRLSRLEVINTGRRRRFTEDEKLRIVAESFAGRGRASATARQHGISRSLLNRWRKWVRQSLHGQKQIDGFVPA
ncbi:transposase-like protein [Rhizobium mesoamericanum]|nr:transposase-like protein [Rhizobium mesoamericanum]